MGAWVHFKSDFRFVVMTLALLIGTPCGVLAQQVGDSLRNHVLLDGKQVPLPHGEWTIFGLGVQDFDMPALGAFGAVRSMVLVQRDGRRVVAVAEINTNVLPVSDGWGRAGACARGQQFLLVTRYLTGWDTSCLFIQPTRLTGAGPATWHAARRLAATSGLTLPELALSVGLRLSDRQDIIDLRFHFDPSLFGAGLDAGAWSTEAVKGDLARLEAVGRLAAWVLGFDGLIAPGLRNAIGEATAEMPQSAAFVTETPQVDGKLRALERLLDEGAISRAEYLDQARVAMREVPVLVERTGGLPVSVQKNISFRVFGSSVDYALAFIVTLDSPLSAAITASIVAIHSVIFVLNDNYWEDYWAKRSTRDANRVIDFVYIGEGV